MLRPVKTLSDTTSNQTKVRQAQAAWGQMLSDVLRRGYHGTIALEAVIQDGTIQHLRRRLEQIEK